MKTSEALNEQTLKYAALSVKTLEARRHSYRKEYKRKTA